jgi:hypothetical protein
MVIKMRRYPGRDGCKRNRQIFSAAALTLLILAVGILAGCGRLSLHELLESEQPGEFYISPGDANLQIGRSLGIRANGGFTPYTYSFLTPGVGTFDEQILVYTAPDTLADTMEEVEIEAEDNLGSKDRILLKVYTPLHLEPPEATLALGRVLDLTASGGVPDPVTGNYLFTYDGPGSDLVVTSPDTVRLTPSVTGSYAVGVSDSINNYSAAVVLVVPTDTLAISPTAAVVKIGGALSFSAVVPAGNGFSFSTDIGSITPAANPATYTAPAVESVATVTLTDTTTSQSVTATVYVKDEEPEDLYVIPAYTEILVGERVDLVAGGGMGPYTFSFKPDTDPKGTLEQTGPTTAIYTAPGDLPARDQIMVEDALGSPPVYAIVKVSKK